MKIVEIKNKNLVSGDSSSRITLETLYQEDVIKLAQLTGQLEVSVKFDLPETK